MYVLPLAFMMLILATAAQTEAALKRNVKRRINFHENQADNIALNGEKWTGLRTKSRRAMYFTPATEITGTYDVSDSSSVTTTPVTTSEPTKTTFEPSTYPTTTTARTTSEPTTTTFEPTTTTAGTTSEPTTTTFEPTTTTTGTTSEPTTTTFEPTTTSARTTSEPTTTTFEPTTTTAGTISEPTTTTFEPTTTTARTTSEPATTTFEPTTTTAGTTSEPTTTTFEPTTTTVRTTSEPTTTTFEPTTYPTFTTTVDPDVECTREYSCLNCTAARICAPTYDAQSLYEVKRFTCSSPTPYCNYTTGTCSNLVDPQCSDIPHDGSNFICMRDGYFPDPRFCSVYYHCQKDVATKYICEHPLQYNPFTQNCDNDVSFCSDMVVECQKHSSGIKLMFGEVDQYFVYCENNSLITVDRCIGAYKFDYDSQLCVPTCPHEGLFPKADNCANFYQCSQSSHILSSSYVMTDLTCPEGQGFSESAYRCVDRSLASNCNITYPDLFNK